MSRLTNLEPNVFRPYFLLQVTLTMLLTWARKEVDFSKAKIMRIRKKKKRNYKNEKRESIKRKKEMKEKLVKKIANLFYLGKCFSKRFLI